MVKQLVGGYKCNNPVLMKFLELAHSQLQQFAEVTISHVSYVTMKLLMS